MSNFPQYNYQPQQLGYQPQMQPMYQPQPVQQAQPDAQLYCRMVASAEEARGVPVDFSGRPMIFPHLNAGRIYVKMFDPGSGSAVFREFRMHEEKPEAAVPQENPAPMSAVQALEEAVAKMQEDIKTLKAMRRRSQPQEVLTDED